jgi:hypothetical protein
VRSRAGSRPRALICSWHTAGTSTTPRPSPRTPGHWAGASYSLPVTWQIRVPDEYFQWRDGRPDLYLSTFNRNHHNLFGLGYLEINSSAYTVFDHISNILAQYLHDQQHAPAKAAAFDRLIAEGRPQLNGGIRFLDSARHRSYLDARTYRHYLADVRKRIGWQNLTPGMFDSQRVTTRTEAVHA